MELNAKVGALRELLRHRDIRTTMGYVHAAADHLADEARKVHI